MERAEKFLEEQAAKDAGDSNFALTLSRFRKALHEQLYKTEPNETRKWIWQHK
jgi:hypothetical protein